MRPCRSLTGPSLRERLIGALLLRSPNLPQMGVYRSKPDPRRTRRQRLLDVFDAELDRSDVPVREPRGASVLLGIASSTAGLAFDLLVFALPLLFIRWLHPGPVGLMVIGLTWIWIAVVSAVLNIRDLRRDAIRGAVVH